MRLHILIDKVVCSKKTLNPFKTREQYHTLFMTDQKMGKLIPYLWPEQLKNL